MVNIFAREITDNLTSLVKQIDAVVGSNKDQQMAAFVVILTDEPDAVEPKLKELAKTHGIVNTPLTIFDGTAGPPSYNISQDADVTVTMWVKRDVKSSHAFAAGKLDAAGIEKVVSATKTILE